MKKVNRYACTYTALYKLTSHHQGHEKKTYTDRLKAVLGLSYSTSDSASSSTSLTLEYQVPEIIKKGEFSNKRHASPLLNHDQWISIQKAMESSLHTLTVTPTSVSTGSLVGYITGSCYISRMNCRNWSKSWKVLTSGRPRLETLSN